MLINIQTLTGEEQVINVSPQDRVYKVKEALKECFGTPPVQQRLMFNGRKMRDEDTLASYKLQQGSVIQLIVALRAGSGCFQRVDNVKLFKVPSF